MPKSAALIISFLSGAVVPSLFKCWPSKDAYLIAFHELFNLMDCSLVVGLVIHQDARIIVVREFIAKEPDGISNLFGGLVVHASLG